MTDTTQNLGSPPSGAETWTLPPLHEWPAWVTPIPAELSIECNSKPLPDGETLLEESDVRGGDGITIATRHLHKKTMTVSDNGMRMEIQTLDEMATERYYYEDYIPPPLESRDYSNTVNTESFVWNPLGCGYDRLLQFEEKSKNNKKYFAPSQTRHVPSQVKSQDASYTETSTLRDSTSFQTGTKESITYLVLNGLPLDLHPETPRPTKIIKESWTSARSLSRRWEEITNVGSETQHDYSYPPYCRIKTEVRKWYEPSDRHRLSSSYPETSVSTQPSCQPSME